VDYRRHYRSGLIEEKRPFYALRPSRARHIISRDRIIFSISPARHERGYVWLCFDPAKGGSFYGNEEMTPKQAVLAAMKGERPTRVPTALMAGGVWCAHHMETTLQDLAGTDKKLADMLVRMAGELKSDIVYAGSGYTNLHAGALGCGIVFRDVGAVDIEKPAIASEDGLGSLDPGAPGRHPLVNTVRDAYRIARKSIGDEYLVTLTAWGPFTNAARIAGEETFVKSIYKNPKYVEKLLEFVTDMLIHFYEPLVAGGAIEVITLGDPTASGDLISRQQFERFAVPHLKRFCGWASSKGVMTLLHVCGDTTDRLDLFPRTGAQCVSLDHKADIFKAREVLDGRMCVAGNVDPLEVMERGSVADVESQCARLLEKLAGGGGFILMPGCDIPPSVPFENIRAMMRVGRGWMV